MLEATNPTEEAAKSDIDRCMKEDSMYETARLLVDIVIKARMEMHGADRYFGANWPSNHQLH